MLNHGQERGGVCSLFSQKKKIIIHRDKYIFQESDLSLYMPPVTFENYNIFHSLLIIAKDDFYSRLADLKKLKFENEKQCKKSIAFVEQAGICP